MKRILESRALVGISFCLALTCGFNGTSAWANPVCADLFRDHTETDKRASEIREKLYTTAHRVFTDAVRERLRLTKEYRSYLDTRRELSASLIEKEIATSPTLRKLDMQIDTKDLINGGAILPPEISRQTRDAMASETISSAALSRVLVEDPYFIWLKHNAFAEKSSESEAIRFRGVTIRGEKNPADPVAIYLHARAEGSQSDVALMVVQRAMDPLMSPDLLRAIDRIVYNDEVARTLEAQVLPWLESGRKNHGYDNADIEAAWRRFPSPGSARENLRALLDAQALTYGSLFSRSSYERVLNMAVGEKHPDPILSVIQEYSELRTRGLSDVLVTRALGGRMEELRTRIGASPRLSVTSLYQVVDRILTLAQGEKLQYRKLTYEYLLADVFAEPHQESQLVTGRGARSAASREIQALRKIIELHENLATEKSTMDYLMRLTQINDRK